MKQQKQTTAKAKKADELEKWLEENLPHITMKDKSEYRNQRTAMTFICAEHGEYIVQPRAVKQAKFGCHKCGAQAKMLPYNGFIFQAKQVHGEKYSYYEEEKAEWKGSNQKVKIYCPFCQEDFWQMGSDHLNGSGCPVCAVKSRQLPYNDFIIQARAIHGEKYSYYPEKEAEWGGNSNKVKICCLSCQKDFLQTGSNHLKGQGCPVCNIGSGIDSEKNFLDNPELAESDCYLYYIKIADSYKIGITNNIAQRFAGEQYELLNSRKTTRLYAWRAEQVILWEFAECKQKNDKIRRGGTECFGTDISQFDNFDEIFNHNFTEPIN